MPLFPANWASAAAIFMATAASFPAVVAFGSHVGPSFNVTSPRLVRALEYPEDGSFGILQNRRTAKLRDIDGRNQDIATQFLRLLHRGVDVSDGERVNPVWSLPRWPAIGVVRGRYQATDRLPIVHENRVRPRRTFQRSRRQSDNLPIEPLRVLRIARHQFVPR